MTQKPQGIPTLDQVVLGVPGMSSCDATDTASSTILLHKISIVNSGTKKNRCRDGLVCVVATTEGDDEHIAPEDGLESASDASFAMSEEADPHELQDSEVSVRADGGAPPPLRRPARM